MSWVICPSLRHWLWPATFTSFKLKPRSADITILKIYFITDFSWLGVLLQYNSEERQRSSGFIVIVWNNLKIFAVYHFIYIIRKVWCFHIESMFIFFRKEKQKKLLFLFCFEYMYNICQRYFCTVIWTFRGWFFAFLPAFVSFLVFFSENCIY